MVVSYRKMHTIMGSSSHLSTADNTDLRESRLSPRLRRAFGVSKRAATQVLRRRFRLLHLLSGAYSKLGLHGHAMGRVRADFETMMRMTKAWTLREYRAVPWKSLIYVVGAVIYFVNPVDLIPDVLVGIGFIDDAAVAAAVVRAVHDQLESFRAWEERAALGSPADAVPSSSIAA